MLLPVESWDSWRCRNGWLWVTHGPEIWKYESKVLGSVEVQSDDPQEISFKWFFKKRFVNSSVDQHCSRPFVCCLSPLKWVKTLRKIMDSKGLSKEQERGTTTHLAYIYIYVPWDIRLHDPGPWARFFFQNKHLAEAWLSKSLGLFHIWGNRFTRIHTFSKQPEQPEVHERSPPSYILHPQGSARNKQQSCKLVEHVFNWESLRSHLELLSRPPEVIQSALVALVALVLMVPALVAPLAVRLDHNSLCSLANKARRVGTFQTSC